MVREYDTEITNNVKKKIHKKRKKDIAFRFKD